jgi:CRP/FNR family cyclic AMP-dependent transcriptional regulator
MTHHHWIDAQLASLPLFRGLSNKQLRVVSGLATQLELPAGKQLTCEGHRGDEFILVEQGHVEVRRANRVIATCGPGEYVGEISLLTDRRRTATVVATTPVVIDVIGRREFHGLMHQLPAVAEQVRTTGEHRLREFENEVRAKAIGRQLLPRVGLLENGEPGRRETAIRA